MSTTGSHAGDPTATDEVEVRVRAVPAQLPVIRSVAETMAIRADFDLDTIADLKLAVDEACSMLITHAAAGSRLTCVLAINDGGLQLTGTVRADDAPATTGFGWRVLTALADEVTTWADDGDGTDGTRLVHLSLYRGRPGEPGPIPDARAG